MHAKIVRARHNNKRTSAFRQNYAHFFDANKNTTTIAKQMGTTRLSNSILFHNYTVHSNMYTMLRAKNIYMYQ